MDKSGVFHANQTSMYLDPYLRVRLACRETGLSPPDLCLSCFRVCLLLPCDHLEGKG